MKTITVQVRWSSKHSIKSAELRKNQLENNGYKLVETHTSPASDKSILVYSK